MSATDEQIVEEAYRRWSASTSCKDYDFALIALRLKAEGWSPPVDPLDELTRRIMKESFKVSSETVADCKGYWGKTFPAIRAILAEHEAKLLAGALVPDAEGWVKTPYGIQLRDDGDVNTHEFVRAVKVLP